ncbi:hypothetical protein GQR58_001994 [Nymphon striatum]|nr:hypothetical protein GQR58_001994 [Nymphon striatum]
MIPTRNISVKLLDGWSRRADTGCHHCGPIPTLLVKAVLAGVTRAVPKRGLPDILPSSHAAPELLGLVARDLSGPRLTASSGAAKYRKLVPVPKASHSSESAGRVCATATAKTTTSVSTVRTRIFSCLCLDAWATCRNIRLSAPGPPLNPAVWHAAAVRICRVKITLAYSSNVLVVPGFIICTIAAPSRMTLVTTGASDLALESSSMQFRHFGQFPLRQALPFPSCQPLSGHPCFLLQMGFQVPQAQPQVRSHLSHLPSGLQLFSIEIDI